MLLRLWQSNNAYNISHGKKIKLQIKSAWFSVYLLMMHKGTVYSFILLQEHGGKTALLTILVLPKLILVEYP